MRFHGQRRQVILGHLVNEWLPKGPPVAILQGFPGCGKTQIAAEIASAAPRRLEPIVLQPDWTDPTLDLFIELEAGLSAVGIRALSEEFDKGAHANLAQALLGILRNEQILIVIDEFQRLFSRNATAPPQPWQNLIEELDNSPSPKGRLLLISNRAIKTARWCESAFNEEVHSLPDAEAVELLTELLESQGVALKVPSEKRFEVVHRLGGNPRALRTLATSLRSEMLDDLMSAAPDLSTIGDVVLHAQLVEEFERELLERALPKLEADLLKFMRWLSVHRRPFYKEAMAQFTGGQISPDQLRRELFDRFLLEQTAGGDTPHPLAREISVSRLREESTEWKRAHNLAANYYFRPFKAKQMSGASTIVASYTELRHHLFEAGRIGELHKADERLTKYALSQISLVSPVPDTKEALEERIALLLTVPSDLRPKVLEYHLARCLLRRGMEGDRLRALGHIREATGWHANSSPWILRLDLEFEFHGIEYVTPLINEALMKVGLEGDASPIYLRGAELLAKLNRLDDAIKLLEKGIRVIPPEKNLFTLYEFCADLLAKADKTDEALVLLEKGIKVISPDKGLFSLYQSLGEMFCRSGKPNDAISSLREGLRLIPAQFGRYKLTGGALYLCAAVEAGQTLAEILGGTGPEEMSPQELALGNVLQCQMRGDWQSAAEVARKVRQQFPTDFVLANFEALSRLAVGDAESAWRALSSFPAFSFSLGSPSGWLVAFIHLRRGARTEASDALATYLGRSVDESRELNEGFLLRLWDQQEVAPESSRLCFHFPIMPASLTGLGHPVRRVPFGKPVLPPAAVVKLGTITAAPSAEGLRTPEIYVSYAWGEDSTPVGRQREEIVDRLCDAVVASGRGIGRDKDRMKGGDSIERFAQEISKAKRIVAVISEKSLNSEFCMANELFRAFRRCDYRREEFQEKVIALVMDDAKSLLHDNLALVTLARAWQERMEKLRTELQSVDPGRKSPDLWRFVDMVEEMCPRLPDMLGALKDIVMKRGFEEITKDGFQEVISRLPPKTAN